MGFANSWSEQGPQCVPWNIHHPYVEVLMHWLLQQLSNRSCSASDSSSVIINLMALSSCGFGWTSQSCTFWKVTVDRLAIIILKDPYGVHTVWQMEDCMSLFNIQNRTILQDSILAVEASRGKIWQLCCIEGGLRSMYLYSCFSSACMTMVEMLPSFLYKYVLGVQDVCSIVAGNTQTCKRHSPGEWNAFLKDSKCLNHMASNLFSCTVFWGVHRGLANIKIHNNQMRRTPPRQELKTESNMDTSITKDVAL